MSKYKRLREYLTRQFTHEVILSLDEIETILKFKLPKSAYQYQTWWGNQLREHRLAWLSADYRVAKAVLGQEVRFISTKLRQKPLEEKFNVGQYYQYEGAKCWVFFSGTHSVTGELLVVVQRLDEDMRVMAIPHEVFFESAAEIG